MFFTTCVLCGNPRDDPWSIGMDISIVPTFEIIPRGNVWVNVDLGEIAFTGYVVGSGVIFSRDDEFLILSSSSISPLDKPLHRPGALEESLRLNAVKSGIAAALVRHSADDHGAAPFNMEPIHYGRLGESTDERSYRLVDMPDSRAAAQMAVRCMRFLMDQSQHEDQIQLSDRLDMA